MDSFFNQAFIFHFINSATESFSFGLRNYWLRLELDLEFWIRDGFDALERERAPATRDSGRKSRISKFHRFFD